MKIHQPFKNILYLTLFGLYTTGLVVWILQTWFKVDNGFGPEAPASTIWYLRLHAWIGLWFLMVFGYLYGAHIQPGLMGRRKRKSGWILLALFGILFVTVPGLYYITNDDFKNKVALIHTVLGLVLFAPFFVHLLLKNPKALETRDERIFRERPPSKSAKRPHREPRKWPRRPF